MKTVFVFYLQLPGVSTSENSSAAEVGALMKMESNHRNVGQNDDPPIMLVILLSIM